MTRPPPHIAAGDVGKACEMTTRAAANMLRRAGIGEKLGGRWVVGERRLRERLPEVYDRVFEYLCLQSGNDPNRPAST